MSDFVAFVHPVPSPKYSATENLVNYQFMPPVNGWKRKFIEFIDERIKTNFFKTVH